MKRTFLATVVVQLYFTLTGMAWAADKPAEKAASMATAAGISATVLFAFASGLAFYFLPAIIGFYRKKDNKISILMLNLFLGWSLIGWVVAIVWATSKDKITVQTIYVQQTPPASSMD